MLVKVDEILNSEADVFNGLSKTWCAFQTGTVVTTAYMFHKPENKPRVGEELEGTIMPDKRGQNKFTKAKAEFGAPAPTKDAPPAKVYKADPDKLTQDKSLTVATNMSIQRQVAVKAAVDLIVSDVVAYQDLYSTYTAVMELLTEPNWRRFIPPVDNLPGLHELDDGEIKARLDEVFREDADGGY